LGVGKNVVSEEGSADKVSDGDCVTGGVLSVVVVHVLLDKAVELLGKSLEFDQSFILLG